RWDLLSGLYRKWSGYPGGSGVLRVGYERYGMQADLEYFDEKMREKPRPGQPKLHITIEEVSWTREGPESKEARVGRLEPDFRNGSFFIPDKVYYPESAGEDDSGDRTADRAKQGGTCLWYTKPGSDDIFYKRRIGPSNEEKACARRDEFFRLFEPIKRRDEQNNIYDLTRVFIQEFMFFPLDARKDLVDATSRVYDMDPRAAQRWEHFEPESYPDD
ncbi:MAG: hypothetical protein ACRECF_00695, partial [Methyloceanibacter sp.]